MPLTHRKLDLHVHTPASHDFNDKTVSPHQIIDRALEAGLDAIGVTDHNSVDFIDVIAAAAITRGFVVFPGFEISCHGAKGGPIHVIGLFEPGTPQTTLTRVLGALGVRGSGVDALTTKSVDDVVNVIRDHDGLPILAHANSTHGALEDIRGNPRIALVRNPKLSAVEATAGDFAKPVGSRLCDRLNGTDPQYQRKLAVYRASDNPVKDGDGHCVSSIGSHYTVFCMGELTLEALRECFEDPDARIIQPDDCDKLQAPGARLVSIKIDGGFLGGLDMALSPGMNSIIGGTGTGKSLLIEFLRFALGRPPHDKLLKEHKDKLDKQLGNGGKVTVRFYDPSGEEYELVRTYQRRIDAATATCQNLSTGEEFTGNVVDIFPMLSYSQNEILEVTRDPRAQRDLLDNFRTFERLRRERSTVVDELRELDRRLVEAFFQAQQLTKFQRDLATIKAKLKRCETSLRGKVSKEFGAFQELEEARDGARASLSGFDELTGNLEELDASLADVETTPVGSLAEPARLVRKECDKTQKQVRSLVAKAVDLVASSRARAERVIKSWEHKVKFAGAEQRYRNALKVKQKAEQMETERRQFAKDKENTARRVTDAQAAAATMKEVRKLRLDALRRLDMVQAAYFSERDEQAKAITERSEGKLRIVVTQGNNKDKYSDNLAQLKIGSLAEHTEVDRLVIALPVVEFVEIVLDGDVDALSQKAKLTEVKAQNIVDVLRGSDRLTSTLALQYESLPEDTVDILYRKQDGQHYPLSELSMGQRADALMLIALGDSQMPVVIDQPEDALDISSIWDDVCRRLRVSKHRRQFLFTTHNSSIAVASDSDEFHVMDADATRGWVARSGSIDEHEIKRDVITHLEGGKESYDLKRKKYGSEIRAS